MFKRHIQIKLVNPKKLTEEEADQKIKHAGDLITDIMWKSSKFVAGYIILDTCRKVLIIMAEKS